MKNFISKIRRKAVVVISAAVSALALAVCASAEEVTEATDSVLAGASDQILEQFSGAAADITPIIIGVLGAGLGIFVIFVGIKLGKKMFTTVSK